MVVMEGKATGLFATIFDAQHNPHAKPQLWTQVTECCVKWRFQEVAVKSLSIIALILNYSELFTHRMKGNGGKSFEKPLRLEKKQTSI